MAFFLLALIGLFLLGIGLLWLVWRTTKRLKSIWLREALRALAMAIAFTPTIVPFKGAHIGSPMPAFLALLYSVSEFFNGTDAVVCLTFGGIPLLIVAGIICLFRIPLAYSADRRRNGRRRSQFNQPFFPNK